MFQKIIAFLKNVVLGDWKPTIAAIFGVIIGICLTVIAACGSVLRQAIIDEKTVTDPTAHLAAIVTRDGVIIAIGALCLVILLGATALTVAKFMTAIARQRAIKHRYDAWKAAGKTASKHDPHSAKRVISIEERNRRHPA